MAKKLLIIDDEKNIHTTLGRGLELEGFEVLHAFSCAEGVEKISVHCPELVLLDLKLGDGTGLEVLIKVKGLEHQPVIVMMSGHGTLEVAMEAVKLGAVDFIEKPVAVDRVALTLRNALRLVELDQTCHAMQRSVERRHGMVGSSPALKKLIQEIHQAAPTKARVLISGQSGVGKELVAQAIHEMSPRSGADFIKVNCAAIPENLVESELFGHEKGAFTGAERRYIGKFERADSGTLFLDEIGEMPLSVQPRLLRVLQEGELERVGGKAPIPVNVRVIAATNRNLQEEVAQGRFREDLYYRLNVIPLVVPSLRARKEDVSELASFLLGAACRENELGEKHFSDDSFIALEKYDWPGNIRELSHTVTRLAIMNPGPLIDVEAVKQALPGGASVHVEMDAPEEGALYALLETFEREVIEKRLKKFDGKVAKAAQDLGLERSHLYKKMRFLQIERYP